jgi:catechol-2,3-dioxygenase
MLTFGVVALRVIDRRRAEEFWCAALGYEIRQDGFGG